MASIAEDVRGVEEREQAEAEEAAVERINKEAFEQKWGPLFLHAFSSHPASYPRLSFASSSLALLSLSNRGTERMTFCWSAFLLSYSKVHVECTFPACS